jgi:hypothetical protein
VKPYYEADGVTLYHGDCREVLPALAPVDLVLTDPPYNVGFGYLSGDDARPDYPAWCAGWFRECRRLSPAVALTPGVANVGMWCAIEPPAWILCWHKPAAMGRCPVGFNNWEPVLLWGKPKGRAGADVITAPIVPDPAVAAHPCPKPLRWAHGLLARLCNAGTVLDPFAGSGTTLRAAKDAGLCAVGIEVEERYCEIAARRLQQGVFAWGDGA